MTLDTKFTVLESLLEAGTQLREENCPELGQFLSLSVTGLCGGLEGLGWARVKVRGLETSLLTQSVLSVVSLARLGQNCPGWLASNQGNTSLITWR